MTMIDSDVPELEAASARGRRARTKRSAFAIWFLCLVLGGLAIALSLSPLLSW
jgi:fatty acid desaturase